MQIRQEEAVGAVMLRLQGSFDAQGAVALRAAVEQLPGREVVLDFTRVREFQDLAVPVLCKGLPLLPLRLMGLAHQHERVFRCFGVGVPSSPARPYWTPEDALLS
ncbi:MAG: STAS domain-containing protein [Myxococcaceae bacterium]